jgi:hypothetical protein
MSPQQNSQVESISEKRLWFGTAGTVVAWVLAGILNVLFAWQACMGGEAGWGPFTSTGMEILLGCITFGLLTVGVFSGITAYRNWRTLSDTSDLISAEAKERKQFMGLVGIVVGVTLGLGMAWFSIPVYVLNYCTRWR